MKSDVFPKYILFIPLIFFLIFAGTEFFLLLRHKSPYVSDSYYYKHIFYAYQGNSFDQAYEKVVSQIDMSKANEIEKNFYLNKENYKNSLGFFTKRPLYPFVAFLINSIAGNEYLAFLLPTFVSFIGSIFLCYMITNQSGNPFYAFYTTFGLVAFYPFLDWSTYFLTDAIGTFFWMGEILIFIKYLRTSQSKWLWLFSAVLAISLFNREQSILMVALIFLVPLLLRKLKSNNRIRLSLKRMLAVSFFIVAAYSLITYITGQKTLLDTIVYTQNNYGLNHNVYSLPETANYVLRSVYRAHWGLLKDLASHHWWLVHVFIGTIGIIYTFLINKKVTLIDSIILASGIASYLAIFLYPVLSYRYFIPVVVMFSYFSSQIIYISCVPKIHRYAGQNKK